MDFEWVAIALGDVVWISLAFALGFVARSVQLPPLVGFLVAGFLLNAYGIASGEMLHKLSDLAITLLLFTVGLKLNLRTSGRPQIWAVTRHAIIRSRIAARSALIGRAMVRGPSAAKCAGEYLRPTGWIRAGTGRARYRQTCN